MTDSQSPSSIQNGRIMLLINHLLNRPWGRALAIASLLSTVVIIVALQHWRMVDWWFIDGQIYAAGGRAAWDGISGNLYENFPGPGPFTYTPFAAAIFGPLGKLPPIFAAVVFQVASVVAACVAVATTIRATGVETSRSVWSALILALPIFAFYPAFRSVGLGQIDSQILALVLIDLLVLIPMRAPGRGVLTGLMAAIKLTPAIFLIYLLTRRDWRALGAMLMSGAVATGLGFVVMPRDSWDYWITFLWRTDRVGAQFTAANQSISAVLSRAFQPDQPMISGWVRVLWLFLVIAVVLFGAWTMTKLVSRGLYPEAILANAMIGLLVSPMSWLHHWVWAVPMIAVLWWRRSAPLARLRIIVGCLGVLATGFNPRWLFGTTRVEDGVSNWNAWQQVVGSLAVWWGLAFLVTCWALASAAPKDPTNHPLPPTEAALPPRS